MSPAAAPELLSDAQIHEVLSRPNGSFALLELVRSGRIDAERAVTAIDAATPEPFLKRLFLTVLDTLFTR
jgi:hypothetical protein